MKQEKYEKALATHAEKLEEHANALHDLVDEIHGDSISWNEIIGMLEVEKMFRFSQSVENARNASLLEALEDLAGLFDEEEE